MERGPTTASYPAERAAALAGVPISTLYYWARNGIVVPSVSRDRVMKWSYSDLLVLRLVDWLRQDKDDDDHLRLPKASMPRIRKELSKAESLGEHLLDAGLEVYVDAKGRLAFRDHEGMYIPLGSGVSQEMVDTSVNLVRPFDSHGLHGPDLVHPRPTLRILPGKLSGEPHVDGTRVPTNMLAALGARRFDEAQIIELYPMLSEENVREALALEKQLEANLGRAA
jgi:uncharacterized protein (DUF433 family)